MLTWNILRAAGIGSYLMLWATVCWGLVGTSAVVGKRISKITAINVHQFLSTAAFVLLGVHIGGLLLDTFVPFGPLDVVVPLHSSYEKVPVALGIAAMYVFAVVIVSSWARKRIGTKLWRALHLLAVPSFALALVHGVFAGTDTARPWMWWGYVGTGGVALFLMLFRAFTIGLRPDRAALPENLKAAQAARAARAQTPAAAAVGSSAAGSPPAAAPAERPASSPSSVPSGAGEMPAPNAGVDEPAPASTAPSVAAQVTSPGTKQPAQSADTEAGVPPTVVVRVELVVEGDQARGRRSIDVPVPMQADHPNGTGSRNGVHRPAPHARH